MDPTPLGGVDINWLVALPLVVVVVTALVAMMADAFSENKTIAEGVTAVGLALAIVACLRLWQTDLDPTFARASLPATGQMVADRYAMFLCILFCAAGLLTVLTSRSYLQRQGLFHAEYHILMLFAIAGMMLMVQATELITLFVALETFSIALYVLSAFARTRKRSSEAGLKYLLLGAFSSAFLLFGIAFVYGATGTTNLMQIQVQLGLFSQGSLVGADPTLMRYALPAGIGLILVGLGFKVAAVPFHIWTPDVYEGAPTPVTAFMSVATKAAAFGALGRILLTSFSGLQDLWGPMVGALAVATMILGNFVAVWQTNIKRLLAYSSIAHAGYLLVALVGQHPGLPGVVGDTTGMLYYLMSYTAMNFGAFAVVAYLGRQRQEYTHLDDFRGLAHRNLPVAIAMSVFMFSLAGVPPFVGFFGKWVLFVNAVERGQTALVVVGVLTSVVSAYYYLKVVVNMWMRAPEPHIRPWKLAPGNALVIGLCAFVTIAAGIVVNPFLSAAENAQMRETPIMVRAPHPTTTAVLPTLPGE